MLKHVLRIQNWVDERKDGIAARAEGQGLAEYALILVLVAVAAFAALQLLGTQVGSTLSEVTSKLASGG